MFWLPGSIMHCTMAHAPRCADTFTVPIRPSAWSTWSSTVYVLSTVPLYQSLTGCRVAVSHHMTRCNLMGGYFVRSTVRRLLHLHSSAPVQAHFDANCCGQQLALNLLRHDFKYKLNDTKFVWYNLHIPLLRLRQWLISFLGYVLDKE